MFHDDGDDDDEMMKEKDVPVRKKNIWIVEHSIKIENRAKKKKSCQWYYDLAMTTARCCYVISQSEIDGNNKINRNKYENI